MTADEFRKLALSLPETSESVRMDHPDFRVRGKIFATLGPDEKWGMVKLTPQQQAELIRKQPAVFEAFKGAWGRGGATKVILKSARKSSLWPVIVMAWRNTAPKRLAAQFEDS